MPRSAINSPSRAHELVADVISKQKYSGHIPSLARPKIKLLRSASAMIDSAAPIPPRIEVNISIAGCHNVRNIADSRSAGYSGYAIYDIGRIRDVHFILGGMGAALSINGRRSNARSLYFRSRRLGICPEYLLLGYHVGYKFVRTGPEHNAMVQLLAASGATIAIALSLWNKVRSTALITNGEFTSFSWR